MNTAKLSAARRRHRPERVVTSRTDKRYLVLGGHGMLGSHIVEALLARGERQVEVFDRLASPLFAEELSSGQVRFHQGDILDRAQLTRACTGIDTVFHTAAAVNFWANLPFEYAPIFAVNVRGTENVLAACAAAGVRQLLFASSSSAVVPHDIERRPLVLADEETPLAAAPFLCHYIGTKVCAEQQVLAAHNREGLLTAALRPGGMYGPRELIMTPGVASGAPGIGRRDNQIDNIYVENVVHAFLLLEQQLRPDSPVGARSYFVTNYPPESGSESYFEFCSRFGAHFGHRFRLAPAAVMTALAWTSQGLIQASRGRLERSLGELGKLRPTTLALARSTYYFSHRRAARDFGYQPLYTAEEGMKLTAAHYKRQG